MNWLAVQAIEWALVFLFGIRRNVRRVPEAPCILVANHNSALDTYALASLLSRRHKARTRVLAAKDTFATGALGWFARHTLRVVLVDRHPVGHHDPLEAVKPLLREGCSLILYPEGTRGEPGHMESFKRGVGVLAVEFPELPVYPVFICGVERCLARNEYLVVPFEISLRVAPAPLFGREFLSQAGGDPREASKRITHALEDAVRRLGEAPAA